MKRALTLAALCALAVNAQQLNHKIDLPKDSPVGLLSADFNNSTATAPRITSSDSARITRPIRSANNGRSLCPPPSTEYSIAPETPDAPGQ